MAVEEIVTQLKTHWEFDYEPKIKALRDLYEVAKKQQWNAATDVPWNLEIDQSGDILDPSQDVFREIDVIKALPEETQTKLDAVFIDSARTIRLWGEDAAEAMGISEQKALDAAGNLAIATSTPDDFVVHSRVTFLQ